VQLLDDDGRVLGPFDPELAPELATDPAQSSPSNSRTAPRTAGLFPKRFRYRLFFRRVYLAPK